MVAARVCSCLGHLHVRDCGCVTDDVARRACITGPRTMEQFDESLRALEIELSDETLKRIDEIFPGYKHSPEGYSW